MTSGDGTGTSGGNSVTSGWRIQWVPVGMIAAISVVVAVINATSGIMEAETGGPQARPEEFWLWEVSSVMMVVLLSPIVSWMVWKIPPPIGGSPSAWLPAAALHFGAASIYSVLHVAGMVAIRHAGYATWGWPYDFSNNGDYVLPFFYEWRKDLLTYTTNALGFWAWGLWITYSASQKLQSAPLPMTAEERIEIRDGARVSLVDPADIAWIEAAGNYVEIHVGGVSHLARGTLAAFEQKLAGRGFLRVHRSRLVNRSRMTAFKSTPSGDVEITLDDGRTIAGSRRFRAAIES